MDRCTCMPQTAILYRFHVSLSLAPEAQPQASENEDQQAATKQSDVVTLAPGREVYFLASWLFVAYAAAIGAPMLSVASPTAVFHERYLYLASVAFCFMAAACALDLLQWLLQTGAFNNKYAIDLVDQRVYE
jgi:hypothetical protein